MEREFSRIFIAIDMPDNAIKEIAKVQDILSKKIFSGKMTELANLHLTLKFIGEVTSEKIEDVKSRLSKIKFDKFDVKLGKAGIFGRGGMPRIAWVKLEGESLWKLQKAIDNSLAEEGFCKEERFMAHITIARIKHVGDKKEFADFVGKIGVKSENFTVDKFKLKKSELTRTGPIYTDLMEYHSN